LRVLRVNFGNGVQGSTKEKLDKLNDYYVSHNNKINSFAQDYKKTSEQKPKFILGYPVKGLYMATLESHKLIDSDFNNDPNFSHYVNPSKEDSPNYVLDISPQYVFPKEDIN
jgi:hypothetical protein